MRTQIKSHSALRSVLRPPDFIQGDDVLHGGAAGQVRSVCGFIRQQWGIEAEFRPDLDADIAGVLALAVSRHQGDAAHPGQVRCDGAQCKGERAEVRRRLMLIQVVVIDVHVLDIEVNGIAFPSENTQPVLVPVFDQPVIDDGEVQPRRCVIEGGGFLGLLVDAAAVKYREQVCELHGGEGAER